MIEYCHIKCIYSDYARYTVYLPRYRCFNLLMACNFHFSLLLLWPISLPSHHRIAATFYYYKMYIMIMYYKL